MSNKSAKQKRPMQIITLDLYIWCLPHKFVMFFSSYKSYWLLFVFLVCSTQVGNFARYANMLPKSGSGLKVMYRYIIMLNFHSRGILSFHSRSITHQIGTDARQYIFVGGEGQGIDGRHEMARVV